MRAVMLEVPQALLEERRAKGLDRSDEMWEGELHMVPSPWDVRMVPVEPVVVECLGVSAEAVDGKLRLTWDGGSADI